MPNVLMYTTTYCPYCTRAKALLDSNKIAYKEISVENQPELREQMAIKSGRNTVPQIFINDISVGGCDDLYALHNNGQLDKLLNKED